MERIEYAVLGIDPGHVNCGFCMVSKEKGTVSVEVPFVGMPALGGGRTSKGKGPSLSTKVAVLWEYCRALMAQKMPDAVVIESQYGHKQCAIAHALQGMFLAQNVPVHMAAPITLGSKAEDIMRRFDYRPDAGSGDARARAKRAHVAIWRRLCPADARADLRAGIKEDDMADAFIYALHELLWYVDDEWNVIERCGGTA